jgi:hypothetical protein
METVGEETTTLSEGYTVSICKFSQVRKSGGLATHTELRAWRGDKIVKMHVDDIALHALRQYLDLWVREIQRRRVALTAIPAPPLINRMKPSNIPEFVIDMALNGLFLFGALDNNGEQQRIDGQNGKQSANNGKAKGVSKAGKKPRRKRVSKDNKSPTGSSTDTTG